MNIRKADKVYINTGKDKGKTGNVLAVYPKDDAVLIEKINIIKKHLKPTKNAPHGGISEIERPMNVSKLSLVCPNCSKSTSVMYKIVNDKKNRFCKKCNELIG